MDSRLSVLLDLLTELGEGDPSAGIRFALEAHPKLWLAVAKRPLVARPWHESARTRTLTRLQVATEAEAAAVDSGARRAGRVGDWRAWVSEDYLRLDPTDSLLGPAEQTWATREEAQAAADAALLAAGWVLL